MGVPLDRRAITAAVALAAGACTASPKVPDTGARADAGAAFADVVLAYSASGGEPVTCGEALMVCGESEPCGPTEVLGAPDSVSVELQDGELVLGFICSTIVEHGNEVPELRIWGSGALVLEGSTDSLEYEVWGPAEGGNPTFDLSTVELQYVKYIRITGTGSIDAVEALASDAVTPSGDAGVSADAGPDASL